MRRRVPLTFLPALLLALSSPLLAQFGQVEGDVYSPDGVGVANAEIGFELKAMNYKTSVKTNKQGHFTTTVRSGDYIVTCTVNGALVDSKSIHIFPGRQDGVAGVSNRGLIVFRLEPPSNKPAGTAASASPSGELTPEQQAALEKRQEQLAKSANLKSAFSAGQDALEAKQYDTAIGSFTKAAEVDATQVAVWQGLADAYLGAARQQNGEEAAATREKASDAFKKAIEVAPTNAGTYNNYALALAEAGKFDDAKQNLAKAIELDPAGAGKYYFNLGSLLMDHGQTAEAVDQFKKAVDADPNYAEAWYQYGVGLAGKATIGPNGQLVPQAGTIEALQKYLALKPAGPNAEPARQLIEALGGK